MDSSVGRKTALFHSERREHTVNAIIKYYNYLTQDKAFRYNTEDGFGSIRCRLSNSKEEVLFSGVELSSDEVYYFYRRGQNVYDSGPLCDLPYNSRRLIYQSETDIFDEFIHYWISENIPSTGSYLDSKRCNKLVQLKEAKDLGLTIPSTLITNRKSHLIDFMAQESEIIIKPINDHIPVQNYEGFCLPGGTQLITPTDIEELDEVFFMSLFQEKLDKAYEIRAFVWQKRIWAMAMFSQSSESTKLDFRNYDVNKPNRCVPYVIPVRIRDKIFRLMERLNLATGSIDMVITKTGEIVFLEINPLGQFSWVSKLCNYYIEREIAKNILRYVEIE